MLGIALGAFCFERALDPAAEALAIKQPGAKESSIVFLIVCWPVSRTGEFEKKHSYSFFVHNSVCSAIHGLIAPAFTKSS